MTELKTIDTGIDCNVIESVQELLDKYGRPNPLYVPEKTYTDLTPNYSYNVVTWPGMEFLKDYIRQGYEEFTGVKGTPLYVQCWVNIITTGQQLTPHTHVNQDFSKEDFVSGHLDLAKFFNSNIVFGPGADTSYNIYEGKDNEEFKLG